MEKKVRIHYCAKENTDAKWTHFNLHLIKLQKLQIAAGAAIADSKPQLTIAPPNRSGASPSQYHHITISQSSYWGTRKLITFIGRHRRVGRCLLAVNRKNDVQNSLEILQIAAVVCNQLNGQFKAKGKVDG